MDHYSRGLLKFVKVVLVVTAVYWSILLFVIVCMLLSSRPAAGAGPEGDVHASLLLFFFVVLSIGGGVLAVLAFAFHSVSQDYVKELDQHKECGRIRRRAYSDVYGLTFSDTSNLEVVNGALSLVVFNAHFQHLANLDTLIPLLCQRRLLYTDELESLLKYGGGTRSEKVSYLLTILDKKGMAGINCLIKCLREEKEHLGHSELASILQRHYHHYTTPRLC